jgi:hypothetical protein
MPRVANLFTLLVLIVLLSAGFKTACAEDTGSGHDESLGDVSSETEDAGKTETHMDTAETLEDDDSDTALKASGKVIARHHEVELVDSEPETDAEGVPGIPETKPSDDRTRSGNLDANYGKSKWSTHNSKNV